MNRIRKNIYLIAFILSLCLVFAGIVCFHSYYNVNSIIQAPSEQWGRTTSLGPSDLYKKQPSVLVNDDFTEILAANKTDFTTMKIDRQTRATSFETFKIKGVEPYKVKQFEWDQNNIYFTEDNNLYFVSKNPAGGYSAKVKIADGVTDFDLLQMQGKPTIAAATSTGVGIYVSDQGAFKQAGPIYKIDKLYAISAVQDNNGVIHVATFAEDGYEFPMYYLTFGQNQWSLVASKVEKSLSASWGIDDIELGLDDTDAYIFYQMTKWDQYGQSAKTLFTVVPINTQNAALNFENLYLTEADVNNSNLYLSEPYTLKTQGKELKFTITRDSADKKYGYGFSSYLVTMDQGKITNLTRATNNTRLITHTVYENYKGDDILIFLDAAGGFNYEAFYTETGKDYVANAARPTAEDYKIAMMETIPGYVSTFIPIIIKFTIYFPVILWFVIAEAFEIRRLKQHPKMTYNVGLLLYLGMKLITFGTYYTPLSISQMPPMLTIKGAYFIYAIGIAVLSMLITKLFRKHSPDMSMVKEFIIFALIDIEVTNLFFATYLT